MGEAARRKAEEAGLVWHHTSILRTNKIWMTGVIEVEGKSIGVEHPAFGEVSTNANLRRALVDFPPLVWLTAAINVPKCLKHFELHTTDKATGEPRVITLAPDEAAAFSLNRVALGFRKAEAPIIPWPDHYGYRTSEGKALNESARDVGDDPDEWWVAEQPLDAMLIAAFRSSPTMLTDKLVRNDKYVVEIHRMVQLCRDHPDAVIPPTWVGTPAHLAVIKAGGKPGRWDALGQTIKL